MSASLTLGITTSGPVAAAVAGHKIEHASHSPVQALEGTLYCVRSVLRMAGATIDDVERVAVCIGPGSFTGLRIGVAFANSVAQARGIPIAGVSSYDVAEFGTPPDAFPRASAVQGKREFYYARIRTSTDAAHEFVSGNRAEIEERAREMSLFWLHDVGPVEQALRVARIGRDVRDPHPDWRGSVIDYGQRPNAVINWESLHRIRERGRL